MKARLEQSKFISILFHSLICLVLFLGIYLFEVNSPVAYNYFLNEDSWIEYGTSVGYLLAVFFILWVIKMEKGLRLPGYILLCLGLFFVAMEEISWGQRLFGVRTPHILAQFNQQSELTLHNAFFFPAEDYLFYAIIIWAVILPEIAYRFKSLNALLKLIGIPLVSRETYPYFILGFYFINSRVVIDSLELGEFIVGLAFLLFSIEVFCAVCKSDEKRNLMKSRLIGQAALAGIALTALIIFMGPQDMYALRKKLHKSAETEYPRYGMYAQAQKIFEYLIGHKELKNYNTLFQYGLFLKAMNKSEAKSILLKALEETKERILENPDKPAPNTLAGKILKALNRPDLAQKEFAEALRKDKIRLAAAELDWQRTDAFKSMGETYIEMGKYDLAREHLQKAFNYAEGGWAKTRVKDLLETIAHK